jgi:hypothetical protein
VRGIGLQSSTVELLNVPKHLAVRNTKSALNDEIQEMHLLGICLGFSHRGGKVAAWISRLNLPMQFEALANALIVVDTSLVLTCQVQKGATDIYVKMCLTKNRLITY